MVDTLPTVEEYLRAITNMNNIIGEGRDRVGFHIPGSNWVYKSAKYPIDRINQREYNKYTELMNSDLPDGIAIPEMHLLSNGVLAARYILGDRPKNCYWRTHEKHQDDYYSCWLNAVELFSDKFSLLDSSALCNIRLVDNDGEVTIYVIDLGE
jgi:hypothetical protein